MFYTFEIQNNKNSKVFFIMFVLYLTEMRRYYFV